MNPSQDFGPALLAALLETAKDKMPGVILSLAKSGQLGALHAFLHDGMIDTSMWKGEFFGQHEMGNFILPLLHAVRPDEGEAAASLIQEWRAAFESEDMFVLRRRMGVWNDAALLRAAILHCGQELDSEGHVSYAVKNKLENEVSTKVVVSMIESSAAIGNGRPLEFALSYLASSDGREYNQVTARAIKTMPLPDGMGAEHGQQALNLLLERQDKMADTADSSMSMMLPVWLTVLEVAPPTPTQWAEIGAAWARNRTVLRTIASSPEHGARGVSAIKAILDSGVPMGELMTNPPNKVPMPLLHCAARANNKQMVQYLLEAGANPETLVGIRAPKNALDVAIQGSETEQLLQAWRARQAVLAVTQNRRTAPASP